MKEFVENCVIVALVMLIIVGVLWFGYKLVEGAGNTNADEIDKVRGYCYDRGYPEYRHANGKYYCYRKVTDEMIPVEMPE